MCCSLSVNGGRISQLHLQQEALHKHLRHLHGVPWRAGYRNNLNKITMLITNGSRGSAKLSNVKYTQIMPEIASYK